MMKKIIVLALMVLFTWTAFAGTTNLDTLELSGDCTIAGSLSVVGNITASSGSVTVAGDLDVTGTITAAGSSIASPYIFTGAITLGEDGTGVDLLCYGDALSASMLWDYTADELIFDGAATAFFGDNNIVYLGDGDGDADRDFALYYDSNDLILLPKLAADGFKIGTNSLPVSITHNGTITVGASDEGHDVTFYGDTAATYMSWDESADDLIFSGAAAGLVIGDEAQLRFGGDASGDVVFNWDTSKFEMESNAAASTWNIGAVGKVFNTTHTGAFEVVGASTFDAITGVGNLSVDGTTAVLDGETSVRGVSAGFTSLEAPDIRFGVSDAIYTKFAVASPSGNLTITHVGGGTDLVTWTAAGGFNLVGAIALDAITAVGNFSVDGTTALVDGQTSVRGVSAGFTSLEAPDIRFGYDASDYMKIAVSTGTGNVAITHTGTNKSVTWTAAAGFDFVGAIALDAVTISGAVSVDDLTQSTDTITGSIHTDGGLGVAKDIFGGSDLDIVDSVTVGDLVIDEAEGVLSFTGATSATISTSSADTPLVLDAADAAAGTSMQYVEITGSVPAHTTNTPVSSFLTITPTVAIPTVANTVNLINVPFTTPIYGTSVASTYRGAYFAPTIGAATNGTNEVNVFEVEDYTGDNNVNVTGIKIGTSDGLGTANAIDIGTGWDAGITTGSPIVVSTAAGSLDFSGATSATISTSTGTCDLVLDSADDTAGSDKTYVSITGSVPAHLTNTPTSIFLDISPTIGIPTVANTVNLIDMVFTTPIYGTGVASTLRGLYFDPTIGASTAGTNNLALIDVAAIGDGDADQNIYVMRVGAMTQEGGETANAIDIGTGWDLAINTASPITLTGADGDIDANDNITCGDLIIDEAAGVLSFTSATSATISTSTAGVGLILDAADMTAGTAQEYVKISGTTPAHAGGTPVDIFLDFDPTIGVNTAAADCHLIDMTFSSPTWGTAVASNLRGIYFAPTIADATLGTNAVALIDIAAISGDAQVSLYGLRFGALTGTAATENAIDIASGWDYGIECESKSRFGLAQGATGINMDGTDPDQAFQAHADITSDVASGAYATVYETMTLSNSTTNDTSIFGDWAELYVTGDLTLARGNLAGSWGHLELVDGGGGNLTLNAVSDAYPSYAGGVVGTVIAPDTLVVGAHRSLAAIVASGAIASGYSVNADGDFAGVLIRADDQPFPVGLLIDDDDATIDIQLSTDQYIDGSTAGVASVGGDSAVEYVAGCMRTVITVDSSSAGDDIDLEDKDDGGGTLLYTFPVGHIRILGAVADLTATSSAEIFQATFPMSLGTTAAADAEATLTGTEADICASTAISYDGAVACDLPPVSAADMTFDGTTSAVAVYLNAAVAAADINGAATVKCTGTVTIHWINLGDY